jgi:hypothetical protein
MRRGRGGKGIPENERPDPDPGSGSGADPVPRPDIAALLNKAATWKAQPGAEEN